MSLLAYGIAYLAIIIFTSAAIYRIVRYVKHPMHVRWELYPVAHEGRRTSYGGSYMEEVDWWEKPREKSLIGELKVMLSEILLLKAVWEHNRSLWRLTYSFHLGLYLSAGLLGLIILNATLSLIGVNMENGSSPASVMTFLMSVLCPVAMTLGIFGACSLFYKRLTDPEMRNYSSFEHFFNLFIFIATMSVVLVNWRLVDPSFSMAISFVANLISFNFTPLGSPLFVLQILLACLLIAYIPLTHMSHFFMKYFLYHDIRWGDEPNVDSPRIEAKIGVVLNYPVTWKAPHIAGYGRSTWAEVATFNPMAETETNKEKVNEPPKTDQN
jgi:nitrate reductase gamma subunit